MKEYSFFQLFVNIIDLLKIRRVNLQEIFPGKGHLVIRNARPSNISLSIDWSYVFFKLYWLCPIKSNDRV